MWKLTLGYYDDGMGLGFLNPDRKLKDFLWKMGTLLTTIGQSMSGQQSKPCQLWQDSAKHPLLLAKQTWLLASRSYWKDNAPVIQLGHRVALQIKWS
jgi:hypothetical protein